MSSIATNAFAAALERLEAQTVEPPERRPAYDLFRPPSSQARTSDDVT